MRPSDTRLVLNDREVGLVSAALRAQIERHQHVLNALRERPGLPEQTVKMGTVVVAREISELHEIMQRLRESHQVARVYGALDKLEGAS